MMRSSGVRAATLCGYLWLAFCQMGLAQATFPCDGSLYLINFNTAGSQLERLNPDPIEGRMNSTLIPLSEPRRRITCLGYNVSDQYLYGLDYDTYELLRIDAQGKIQSLGVPANLDLKLKYHAGQVSPLGRTLVVIGRDPLSQYDKIIYNINLTRAPYLASSQALLTDLPVRLHDLATHPSLGVVYGFDGISKKLVTLGGGGVNVFNQPTLSEYLFALYFDPSGNLYGYGNPTSEEGSQTHYYIDRRTGKTTMLGRGIAVRESDGCSCPYGISFDMKITPTEILPCSEITIEYTFFNATGANWQDLEMRDSFPQGVSIRAFEKNTSNLSTVKGGVGNHFFRLINMNLYLESNTIQLKAWVDDLPPGKYGVQSQVKYLPKLYGDPLLSNNSLSVQPRDSAFFRVVEPKSLKLSSKLRFSCNGDTAIVEAPLEASTYQWSNGSTSKTLRTTQNGQFSLLAKTPCLDYTDTIRIDQRPRPLQTQLMAPERLESGGRTQLSSTASEQGPFTFRWASSPGLKLDCTTCASPAVLALSSGTVQVQVQNARGCVAQDSAFIEVIPVRKIFIPSVFSPNQDQHNDRFFVQGRDGAQVVQWVIKDRWGNQVFAQQDVAINLADRGWDGTYRGQNLPAGSYFYSIEIEFPDGARKTFQGEVQLLR